MSSCWRRISVIFPEKRAAATGEFDNPLDFYHMDRDETYGDSIRRAAAYLRDTKGVTDQLTLSDYKR